MDTMEVRILKARQNSAELEKLLLDYIPFIKKQLSSKQNLGLEFDDMLSIGMLIFVGCIRQYTPGRGSFLSFFQTSLTNRLLDEFRRQKKYSAKILPLYEDAVESEFPSCDRSFSASVDAYSRDQERQEICLEIEAFQLLLTQFGISFSELPSICPKQERSRKQCFQLAKAVVCDRSFRSLLLSRHRLAQNELAKNFSLSPKTIEKHRKYIVVLSLLFLGDYPKIKSYLPDYWEVDA